MSPCGGGFCPLSDEMAIGSVVWHELVYGMERLPEGARRRGLDNFLNSVVLGSCPVLPYDEAAATWHASERARLARLGRTPPFRDGQIAATAFVHGLTVVTANVRDFQHFAGLSIEDWSTTGA
jgi:tRNA(fMet)-specific endonuclease VapC